MSAPASGTKAAARARQVADAVLYEGYVLFPYRASALKNRYRWQWGVVIPQAQVDLGATEPSTLSCEVLVRGAPGARVTVTARFLHLRLRQMLDAAGAPVDELDVDGTPVPTWEEGLEHEVACTVELPGRGTSRRDTGDNLHTTGDPAHRGTHRRDTGQILHTSTQRFALEPGEDRERLGDAGHAVRTTWRVTGALDVTAQPVADDSWRVHVAVRNDTDWAQPRAPRDDVLRHALVGVHAIIGCGDGQIASVIDPPAWAASADVRQRGLHPVLIGDEADPPRDTTDEQTATTVLAAPIILYDHPQIAPESPGPSFDATEVDELLALAVQGLTDGEKRRARATDPRAAALVDRVDTMPAQARERLHGTIRGWGPGAVAAPEPTAGLTDEVRDLLGVGEEPLRSLTLGDDRIEVGDRVRLRPRRRADAHDLFVDGRVAQVERIVRTVEGATYLAVTVDDDPAAELHRWYGRFQYFGVDEVELTRGEATAATAGTHERTTPDDGGRHKGGTQ